MDGPQRSQSHPIASTSPAHSRSSSGAHGNLSHVARRDVEQTNLARPSTSHQLSSRDPPLKDGTPSRDSSRTEASRGDYRQDSAQRHAARHSRIPPEAMPDTASKHTLSDVSHQPRRRTTVEARTGIWELGKTIGAGSMGKVKLARNKETHEQVAIKIVPRQSTDDHKSPAEKERADHSKEIRTAREAAISTLVDHPYICGMRDFVKTRYHWYMLFEYVNGGQMLDYIISHGRLKEKQARKFGRQIASALDYCHRNNIAHRDLKIENILISKNGDIKIIDFGLSNTFTPRGFLKTFCGSLYFAAPELLQAKQYTGPEVDVWSFGIVLYVLVCGKVPFDDQSMPQLHAKIKKGHVDYPPWLTHECRHLISRMLQVEPSNRANMSEVMNHPWIVKGYGGPPDNFLLPRKPLTLPLDREVIRKMEGFDFGSESSITERLTRTINSDDYQKAIANFERKPPPPTPEIERKRGVFDFYKRRNSLSRDTLQSNSSEAVPLGTDPVNAYHPLVSVYFLAREKLERERRAANPGSPPLNEKVSPVPSPGLKAPEAAYTNPATYEMAGEAPTGGRSRPRSRTHGQDEVAEDVKHIKIEEPAPTSTPVQRAAATPEQTSAKKESTAAGLLRKLSTRRHRDHDRPTAPPSFNITSPAPDTLPHKTFSLRRRDRSSSRNRAGTVPQGDRLQPAQSSEREKSGALHRSTSVNSAADVRQRLAKRQASENGAMWSSNKTPPAKRNPDNERLRSAHDGAGSDLETPNSAPPAARTKSLGHARKESIQRRRQLRAQATQQEVREETDAELADLDDEAEFTANESASPETMKPVFLKGLFSVSTTSSKPFRVIEADIIRVLRQLGVQYSSNGKGGFKCKHSPSISLDNSGRTPDESPRVVTPLGLSQSHRRRLSFGFLGGDKDEKERELAVPKTPTSQRNSRRFDEPSDEEAVESDQDDGASPGEQTRAGPITSPRTAGETTTHVQHDLGTNMDLRFEIFVVKVPLLSFHGIQFKKVDGGTWQYKNMAQTILNELKL